MYYKVAINGTEVYKSSNHNEARIFADRLYDTLLEITLEGSPENIDLGEMIYENANANGEVVIAINGRNYEEYLAEVDWIANRIKQAEEYGDKSIKIEATHKIA